MVAHLFILNRFVYSQEKGWCDLMLLCSLPATYCDFPTSSLSQLGNIWPPNLTQGQLSVSFINDGNCNPTTSGEPQVLLSCIAIYCLMHILGHLGSFQMYGLENLESSAMALLDFQELESGNTWTDKITNSNLFISKCRFASLLTFS